MKYKLINLLPGFLLREALEDKIKLLSEKYKIDPKKIELFSTFDPTPNKAYLDWICRSTLKAQPPLRMPEDGEDVKEVLTFFDRFKRRFKSQDIGQYKSFHDLRDEFNDLNSKNITSEPKDNKLKKKVEGAEVFYEDSKYRIIELRTPAACKVYGDGTNWCTRHEGTSPGYLKSDSDNPADNYLYVIFINGEKIAQAYFGDNGPQVMDVDDRPIDILATDDKLYSIFEKKFEQEN